MNAVSFLKSVKLEFKKIVWPSYKEAWMGAMLVFCFAAIAGAFFFVVDIVVNQLIRFILGIGG